MRIDDEIGEALRALVGQMGVAVGSGFPSPLSPGAVDESPGDGLIPTDDTRAVSGRIIGGLDGTIVIGVAGRVLRQMAEGPMSGDLLVETVTPFVKQAYGVISDVLGEEVKLRGISEVQANSVLGRAGRGVWFGAVPLLMGKRHQATVALLLNESPKASSGIGGEGGEGEEGEEYGGEGAEGGLEGEPEPVPASFGEVAVDVRTAEFPDLDEHGLLPGGKGLRLLHDVEMSVTAELGRTKMTVRNLLSLTPGSIVELDRSAGSPIDLLVNGTLIARGEVVVIDEEFGVRISEIVGRPSEEE